MFLTVISRKKTNKTESMKFYYTFLYEVRNKSQKKEQNKERKKKKWNLKEFSIWKSPVCSSMLFIMVDGEGQG